MQCKTCSVLKRFLNNKKMPFIPSLFYANKFAADFIAKAEMFNVFLQNNVH